MHKYEIEIRVQDSVVPKEESNFVGMNLQASGILTQNALSSYVTNHGEIYS